jgi:hypothetical protein
LCVHLGATIWSKSSNSGYLSIVIDMFDARLECYFILFGLPALSRNRAVASKLCHINNNRACVSDEGQKQ